jgi:hypothetical protein
MRLASHRYCPIARILGSHMKSVSFQGIFHPRNKIRQSPVRNSVLLNLPCLNVNISPNKGTELLDIIGPPTDRELHLALRTDIGLRST